MFQMRTAAGGVGDDGVELFRRKLIDVFAGEFLGEFPFAVVRVERAAADCCSGGVMTSQPLRASTSTVSRLTSLKIRSCAQPVSIGDAIFFWADARRDRRDQIGGKLRLDRRRHRFQFAQAFGQQFQNAAVANERLQAELLIKANAPRRRIATGRMSMNSQRKREVRG